MKPSARAKLSATVITLNAAAELAECLASVAFADEILVLDAGSSDGTAALAARLGARVLQHEWLGYGRQKQLAAERAAHDWVLSLDADERLSPELAASIVRALEAPAAPVYRMARRNRFMGRWLAHGEGYPDWCARLYDRRAARWSEDPVHERLVYTATPATLAGDLLHHSADDLGRYLEKQLRYSALAAEAMFARGERAGWLRLVGSPLVRFLKFYLLRAGFADGVPGLVHISVGCMTSFLKYARLIELARSRA